MTRAGLLFMALVTLRPFKTYKGKKTGSLTKG